MYFLIYPCQFHINLPIRVGRRPILDFSILSHWEHACKSVKTSDRRFCIIKLSCLAPFPRFYGLSVSQDPLSQSKSREICENHGTIFLYCERTFDLVDVPLHCMIVKPWPDVLTLSTTFYDLSVSRNLFSKTEMRQSGASGNQRK